MGSVDGEKIFGWHILPFNVLGRIETDHLKLLQNDKSARVIIYCKQPQGKGVDVSPRDNITYSPDNTTRYIPSPHLLQPQYPSHRPRLPRLGLLLRPADREGRHPRRSHGP